MRTFIDDRKIFDGDNIGTTATNAYVELEIPISEEIAVVIYICSRTENSVLIATCWDRIFDELIPQLSDDNVETTVAETWPTLYALLLNGINERYSEGALIVLEDPDYGEKKWFVTSVAGNISLAKPEDLFSERVLQVIGVVMNRSMELHKEMSEREPDQGRMFGRALKGAIGAAMMGALATFLGSS